MTYERVNIQDQRSSYGRKTYQFFIGIQALHHEKSTLEVREVTKLHYRDSTSSNDEFSSYTNQSSSYPQGQRTIR